MNQISNSRFENEETEFYECVEPDFGNQLWRLDDSATDFDLRQRLELHLSICHRCRLETAMLQRLVSEAQSGAGEESNRDGVGKFWFPVLLAAACLAFVFILPPENRLGDAVDRAGGGHQNIVRPVPGEVIFGGEPGLQWEAIKDATSYYVEIVGFDSGYSWNAKTPETKLRIPKSAQLPMRGRFQVLVTPVPEYLAPSVRSASWFRRGGWVAFVGFRMVASPIWLKTLFGISLLSIVGLGLRKRIFHHRS